MKTQTMNAVSEINRRTRPAAVYQIRDITRYKIAQFDEADQVLSFLQERKASMLRVWLLKAYPGELLDVVQGDHFLRNHKSRSHA